ncbi:MAG: cell wall-binding repeat-containing protein [Thermoleophilia bacterium]|nr:cell wall-binding repeat-containing protein [Thermoleophilia bacterium]
MSADRPINADVPAPTPPEEAPKERPKETREQQKAQPAAAAKPAAPIPTPPPPPTRRRQPKPLAPKLLAGLVLIAIVFIAVAVIGGTGGGKDEESTDGGSVPSPAAAPADTGSASAQSATGLGFPVFATGNTTRVGGTNPAANAAAVALAVFPSTTPSQRPAAVTLVAEDDWAGAIAAAVLMSAPVGAPVLFSAAAGMPNATEEALAALDPQGDGSTGGAANFAIGDVAAAEGKVTRLPAGGAAATAAAIAGLRDRLVDSPPAHIVLAPEGEPELAMPAAAWAARSGDPVLFAAGDELPPPTVEYLEKHNKAPIYVLGPSSAISSELVREAEKIGGSVKRVSGENPVANSIALARYSDGGFGWAINDPGHGFVLARSDSPLGAAAAAPLSASGTWGPLLLTDSADTLPADLRDYFLDVKPGYTDNPTRAFYNHVWVIGDQEAIDLNQQAEVNELAELAKIGGAQ